MLFYRKTMVTNYYKTFASCQRKTYALTASYSNPLAYVRPEKLSAESAPPYKRLVSLGESAAQRVGINTLCQRLAPTAPGFPFMAE